MRAASAATVLLLTGCSLTAEPASPSPSARVTAPATPSPSPSPEPATPTPSPRVGLAACPAPARLETLQRLLAPSGRPDDIAIGPDGSYWLSDEINGRITELSSGGEVVLSIVDSHGPEGIVITPDGTVYVAEQKLNRVVSYRPPSAQASVVASLPNRTRNLGLDGLGIDSVGARLLIPDSPNGALRAMPLGGGAVTTLATGLGRPVAATVGPSGDVDVASESSPDLLRVSARGVTTVILHGSSKLDEVVTDGRLLYVTDLDHGTVSAVDEATGSSRVLVTGATDPQGLALLQDGRLALVDSATRTVRAAPTCS